MSAPIKPRFVDFEALEDRLLFSATPLVTVDVKPDSADATDHHHATPLLNSDIHFTAKFENTAAAADPNGVGYAPYVGVKLDKGIDLTSAPTYLGQTVQQVAHFENTTGVDQTYLNPYTQSNITLHSGEEFYLYDLPFGSFVPGQEPVKLDFHATTDKVNEGAVAGVNYGIEVTGGFHLGTSPTGNGNISAAADDAVITPTVWEVTKTVLAPEKETATGPNYAREWVINVDIANGETLSNIDLKDILQSNLQYTDSASGASAIHVDGDGTFSGVSFNTTPSTTTPGGNLDVTIASATGTASANDIQLHYWTYVPLLDASSGHVISPTTGDTVTSTNGVDATADYGGGGPLAPQLHDTVADPALLPNFDVLSDKSIAIQKDETIVTDVGGHGLSADDTLNYNLNFQVSDYFTFDHLIITDTLSDGQLFDLTHAPTFTWNEAGAHSATFTIDGTATDLDSNTSLDVRDYGNFAVIHSTDATGTVQTVNITPGADAQLQHLQGIQVNSGETVVVYFVSDQLVQSGVDGTLVGGLVAGLVSGSNANVGATTGVISFHTVVQENYVYAPSQGASATDPSVDLGDSISNKVVVNGRVLDNADWVNTATANSVDDQSDDSASVLVVPGPTLQKTIYAVDGSIGAAPLLTAGDAITYKLKLDMPTADVEDLQITDYIPLPAFHVSDLGAGTTPTSLTVVSSADPNAYVPTTSDMESGDLIVVLNTDVYNYLAGHGGLPTVSFDAAANSFTVNVGTFDLPGSPVATVALFFTVKTLDRPMADTLLLTNQMVATYNNTGTVKAVDASIVQVKVEEPVLTLTKGVVGVNSTGTVVGTATFTGSGGFTGTIADGTPAIDVGLQAAAIDAANLTGAQAGDNVRFALVVENSGHASAFDVKISDVIPDGFGTPSNFVVQSGDGTVLMAGVDYTVVVTGNNFTIELTDHGLGHGSVGAGKTALVDLDHDGHPDTDVNNDGKDDNVTDGSNYVVVTYSATVLASADTGAKLTNVADITQYSGVEGGGTTSDNRVTTPVLTDASVTLAIPQISKVLTGTSVTDTGNNAANQAVVGEIVTYTLTITVPDGTTANSVVKDTLDAGLSFQEVTSVVFGPGVSATGVPTAGATPANSVVGIDGSSLEFDLGNIVDTGTTHTITITYTAIVLDVSGNQSGMALNNSATLTYDHADQTGDVTAASVAATPITVSAANVTVVEPALTISMGAGATAVATPTDTLSSVDAGDDVYYTIVITNAGGPTAWNLALTSTLPNTTFFTGGYSIVSVSGSGAIAQDGLLDANEFDLTGTTLSTTSTSGHNIDLGTGSITIIVKASTLATGVIPGEALDTTGGLDPSAQVTWTSLQGTPGLIGTHNAAGVERTGADGVGGALNDYAAKDTTHVTIAVPANSKTIVATSESATTGNDVAIGEIVRYQLTIVVPEGTSPNLELLDSLPTGILFINDGTATVKFVSASGGTDLSSTTLGTLANNTVTALGDTAISTDPITNVDGYGNGTAVYFKLGTITNHNIDNSQTETIVVEFNALVLNTTTNQNGTALTNTSVSKISNDGTTFTTVGTGGSVTATVKEANLTITKTASTAGPVDAGDTFTYTITIANNGTTAAFDIHLKDAVDAIIAANPTAELTITGVNASGVPAGTTVLNNADTSAAVDLTFNRLDVGAQIVVTVTVQVDSGAVAGAEIENHAYVDYTSLPGASGTTAGNSADYGTTVQPLITSTIASASAITSTSVSLGGAASERTGADIPLPTVSDASSNSQTILNNYAITGAAPAGLTVAIPTVDKQWQGGTPTADDTNVASSTGSNVVVGEQVHYDIIVTLPEGTTDSLHILDQIPVGLRVDSISLTINGPITLGSDPTTGFTPVTGTGGNLDLNFGTVTNADDNITTNNTFVIHVTGTVLDVAGNQVGKVLSGPAQLTFKDPDGPTNASATPVTRTVTDAVSGNNPTFTVQEPTLTITKGVASSSATPDAGDILTYTITITNTSGQTAYDISLSDQMSSLLTGFSAVTAVGAGGATFPAGEFVITDDGSGHMVLHENLGTGDIPSGASITLTYSAQIVAGVGPSATITNTADVHWTSTDGVNADERTGADVPFGTAPTSIVQTATTPLDNYALSSTVTTAITASIGAVKSLVPNPSDPNDSGHVTPGEVVTYKITVTLPEGVTPNLQIEDLIPPGMQYVAGSVIVDTTGFNGSLGALTTTPVSGGTYVDGTDVLFNFGSTTVVGDNITTNNTFTITYQAVALDDANVIGISGSQTSENNHALHNNGSGSAFTFDAGTVPLTAVEPKLTVVKTSNDVDNEYYPGQTVTYSITVANLAANGSTADAFDVALRDAIPAGMTYVAGSLTSTAGVAPTSISDVGGITLTFDKLALGQTSTLTFQVLVPVTATSTVPTADLTNTVHLYYDNLPADDNNVLDPSDPSTPADGGDRDYSGLSTVPGHVGTASLGDKVWLDTNANGILDATEDGIGGVTLFLDYNNDGIQESNELTTVTSADGSYSFNNLAAGSYVVRIVASTLPDGAATSQTYDVDGTGTANVATVTLAATQVRTDVDFGYRGTGTIGDTVYFDTNHDGDQDAGELGLKNVDVTLIWAGQDGVFGTTDDITTTHTTNATGGYTFDHLFSGQYRISVDTTDLPAGTVATGGAVAGTNLSVGASSVDRTLATGETNNAVDFGYTGTGALGDRVYNDTNADGLFDGTDVGLAGIDIILTWAGQDGDLSTAADNITYTTTTDATGHYGFDHLAAGNYKVDVDQADLPAGITSLATGTGPGADVSVGSDPYTLALGAGVTNNAVDFGYHGTGHIGDNVWYDVNGNGTQEAGEIGISGVTVTLVWAGLDGVVGGGDDITYTTTTDASGHYAFDNLPLDLVGGTNTGLYTVTLTGLPAGFNTPTYDFDGTGTPGTASVTLTTAAPSTNALDFGYRGTGVIGDRVYQDTNGNGSFDAGDLGLAGIGLTLTWAGEDGNLATTADNATFTTTTDSTGHYTFGNLVAGNYSVDITNASLPTGITTITTGSTGTDVSVGVDPKTVTLATAETNNTIDFGYRGTGSIGDTVFADLNGNGTQDASDFGISGVTVTLTWAGLDGNLATAGDNVVYTTTTDSAGHYSFGNLAPGNYDVAVDSATLPTGYNLPNSDLDGVVTTPNDAHLTLGNGQARVDADFGYRGTASIGDTIYFDTNHDGDQDAGELGLSGIDVTLLWAGADGDFTTTADNITTTVTTDATGHYSFDNLFAGNYRVSVDTADLPTGTAVTTGSAGTNISVGADSVDRTLTAGQINNAVDFGYTGTGALGDRVYNDTNANGLFDGTDVGLAGIDVVLTWAGQDNVLGTADDVTYSTTTDAAGHYGFDHLAAGSYSVNPDQADLPAGITSLALGSGPGTDVSVGFDPYTVTLGAGATNNAVDFGYHGTGHIGDNVWYDVNGDGVQGAGEIGISGVTVTLVWAGLDGAIGGGDDVTYTTTTDASGHYAFDNLPLDLVGGTNTGLYTVTLTGLPSGFNTPTYDFDGIGTPGTATVTLTTAAPSTNALDFGYRGTGVIGDRVYQDTNGNGSFDAGDLGLAGIGLTLTWAGEDGNLATTADNATFTTTTDSTGHYTFGNLVAGNYSVDITNASLPTGITTITTGSTGTDVSVGVDPKPVTLAPAETNNTIDFGYRGTGSIGDTVFADLNGDGTQDASDFGISGVTVTLTWGGLDGDLTTVGDNVVYTTTTDASGHYTFGNLAPGSYDVVIDPATLPTGYNLPNTDLDGVGTPNDAHLTLGNGQARVDADFGYRGTASIGDTIYFDTNHDGDQDAGELGLSGIDVTLLWAGADGDFTTTGDNITTTVTTDATGHYSFDNLFAGNYRVSVDTADLPTGTSVTTGSAGTNISVGADSVDRTLTAGQTNTAVDFGYTGTGALGDRVYNDTNANGLFDGTDVGLAGVDIVLTWAGQDGILGNADDVTYSTTTDAAGHYGFDHLAGGNYKVDVDQTDLPAGITSLSTGTAPGSDISVGSDPYTLALAGGATNNAVDFGYHGTGHIGDYVWYDINGDGVQDAGEPGIPNATVTLDWAGLDGITGNGDDIIYTATTDSTGHYSFNNLPVDVAGGTNTGVYTVTVSGLPAGSTSPTYDLDGTGTPGTTTITLDSLTPSRNDLDFGYRGSGVIGDRVYHDTNGNGSFDAGDLGLSGIDVTLTWAGEDGDLSTTGDNVTFTTTTDATGHYGFANLLAGNYSVNVDDADLPTGITTLTTGAAGTDVSVGSDPKTLALASGETNNAIDFGYRGTGIIGDTIFADLNGNGTQDAIDFGLSNVGLTLTWAGLDGNLLTAGDNVVYTTTTDASGIYHFANLAPGIYDLQVNTATLPANYFIPSYDLDATVTPSDVHIGSGTVSALANNEDRETLDFGYKGVATIGDTVYLDENGNGTQDGLEPGIAGVTIDLYVDANADGLIDVGDTLLFSTTTDASGHYSFVGLLPEHYLVNVTDTAHLLTDTTETQEKDDYGVAAKNNLASVDLADSEVDVAVDFGYQGASSIGDRVWNDRNADGVQDIGEYGITGLTVDLYRDVNGDGLLDGGDLKIATTTTGVNGTYNFAGLNAGDYLVNLPTPPAAATDTYDLDGALATPNTSARPLGSSETATDVDFGYQGSASIGDYVWQDGNGDGIQDIGEAPLAGVHVFLDANGDGIYQPGTEAVATTDAAGHYEFDGLVAGTYSVVVDPLTLPPDSQVPTFDRDLVADFHTTITLGATQHLVDADFGFQDYTPPFISGGHGGGGGHHDDFFGLFGISYSTISEYYATTENPTFEEMQLPSWELIDSTPIFSSPLLSGQAEPGSKIVLSLYNHQGELVESSTVTADVGGNWMAGFAGVTVNGPLTVVSSVVSSDFTAFTTDDNFNFRTNYLTGLSGGYFQSRQLGVEDAFSSLTYARMEAMVAEDEKNPNNGWRKSDYEFLATPALPGN